MIILSLTINTSTLPAARGEGYSTSERANMISQAARSERSDLYQFAKMQLDVDVSPQANAIHVNQGNW